MRKPVHRYEDTAANWSADNPKLPAGWEGVESDTGRYKCGDGATAWNSLGYAVNVGYNGSIGVLASPTIDLNSTLRQTGLTVPTGKVCIVLGVLLRNASIDLSSFATKMSVGWDAATADDLWSVDNEYKIVPEVWNLLTNPLAVFGRSSLFSRLDVSSLATPSTGPLKLGTAGQTLGFFLDAGFGSAATLVADIHGYYANA